MRIPMGLVGSARADNSDDSGGASNNMVDTTMGRVGGGVVDRTVRPFFYFAVLLSRQSDLILLRS
jgi:hypothetical protein